MSPLVLELVKGGFTLVAVLLGSLIGSLIAMKVYFRQKEYELAKQRYLEEGLDVVAAGLTNVLGVVSYNFARSLELCKSFRDSGKYFQASELERGFLSLDQSKFFEIAHHRVGALIGCTLVWEIYQSAMADAHSANSTIAFQVPETIRILSQRDESLVDRTAFAAEAVLQLREVHESCFKYSALTRELHFLGLLLEAQRLDLEAVATFRNRADVQELVARLRAAFADERSSDEATS